jgi:hypothetical protein
MPGSRNSAGKLRREGKPGRRCKRAPTIAIFERRRLATLPRTVITGGAEAERRSSAG